MVILKKAFTMIEMIMVIVVLGITASIGADIIVQLYENYVKTRAINRLQAQTEVVLEQIAKRLQFRIKDSVIARDKTNFNDYVTLTDANDSYEILEWLGKDNEGLRGINKPGWSGFIDLDSPQTNKALRTLKTPGSDLNITNSIIKGLSYDDIDMTDPTKQKPAIIFKGQSTFDLSQFGWDGVDGNYTIKVKFTMPNRDILEINDTVVPDEIFEQYNLSWSAYAIVPEGNNTNDFNLTLHYNYQPWEDENYTVGQSSLLAEHVSTFKFTKIGDTIRLKLCIHDNNQSGNFDFAFCKEKVIF